MKTLLISCSLILSLASLEQPNETMFADCNNPRNISVIIEPCTTIQAQILSWVWTGVGYYNWYIDGILYQACVSDTVVDYSLISNPLGLGNGNHVFSVRGTQTDCSNCSQLRSVTFSISCL